MICSDVVRELSSYLDQELQPALRQALERHLQHCEKCRIVVNTARKTIEFYCGQEPLPLPADIQQEIDRTLAGKLGRKS